MTIFLLFLSVAIGPVIVFWFKLRDRRKIRLLTTFSGAYVFSITALHLMPEAFAGHAEFPGNEHEMRTHLPGMLILAGFFVQLMLDYFSQGIEHGHAHVHEEHGHLPVGVLCGLCVHAFIEGMPLGGSGHVGGMSEEVRRTLLAGIVMHNMPVSIVLMTLLLHQGIRARGALWWMFVFATMSPLGMLLSDQLHWLARYGHELMAVVVGIFLHISTTILFETGEEHLFNRLKVIAILLGAGLALGALWVKPHVH